MLCNNCLYSLINLYFLMFSLAWLAYQKSIIKLPEDWISFHYAKAHQVCGSLSSFPSEAFDLPVLVKTSPLRPVAELVSWGFPSPACKKYNVLCFILHIFPLPEYHDYSAFFSLIWGDCVLRKNMARTTTTTKIRPCLYIKPCFLILDN